MSKTVAETTAKYDKRLPQWARCRDAVEGQDAIHDKGEEYLPKLSGQEAEDYTKYKKQALFYNATGRTYKAYKGLIFRKPPNINADPIEDFVEDCTLAGMSLEEFSEMMVEEELQTSRFGVLVDHPDTGGSQLSQREAEQMGNRPYLVAYKAEDVLEAKTKRIGNRTILAQVRLKEMVDGPEEDEFDTKQIEQIRVLDLDPEQDYAYRHRIFQQTDNDGNEWAERTDMRKYPKMNGQPIKEIPFYMVGGYDYRTPHLLDLVNVNISHYVAYADHRRGVAYTTRPQHMVFGVRDEDMPDEFVIGSGQVYNFPNPEATAMILEYAGTGLSASEKNLDDLKEDMANIGAKMLMPEGAPETATEFVIKKQGENSSLSGVSKNVSDCLDDAIKFAARWMGVDESDITIRLNRDFIPFQATPEQVNMMIRNVQTGKYTEADYLWWLEQNEIVDPTVSNGDRLAEMQTNPNGGAL